MGLIGSALGAAANLAGSIGSAKAMRKIKDNLNQQMQENQDLYDRRYNEDATQRADAQRLITMTEESIKNRNKAAAATAAVMGGTDESIAAEKAANAYVLADTASQIAAQADARKDIIENQFMKTKAGLNGQLNNLQMQKAKNIQSAAQGVADFAGKLPW